MLSRSNVNYEGRKPRRVANSNAAVAHLPTFEPAKITPRGPQPMDDGGLPPFSFVSLDMCQSENNVNHRTSVYLHKRLVVRRGHEFFLKITFSSQYIEHTHKFEVEFTIGESPDSNEGTHIVLEFALGEINGPWACRVVENVGNTVKIGITPSPDCIVGKFHTYVVVDAWDGRHRSPIDENSIIYILFNAWCSDDDVSLPDESQRTAYIMADSGVVYTGQAEQFSARPWEFGQFEQNILDYCIDILDDSKMSLYNRGNVIQVTRKVSALVNSQDDYGILEGKWRGSYAMGTAPTAWTSSVDILEKYATTKSPVCYAQCWVYACVFNTIMRCLGIPCRVVTNFCSAHDNTGNLKTDIVIDENGRMLKERCKDSIWNYHCWNEGYMKRGDLPVGFDGWQILDATPQETSEGIYCCGPAPVKAIKAGLLCYPFDARFIFAEVNSNIHYHLLKPNGTTEMIHIDKTYVGRLILTQDVIPNAAKDITNDYKPLEGKTPKISPP
ncbi:coagulation factor XIII A chain-like [Chanos chanos]|uniref:Coagulation factor XIII A chain-like n=1 Tax=Chanos chanos TaxID=29144 RepID=A0A6J2UVX7_CHACN|nr:coagulation factor XIII A chain [Chanos chanos]